MSALQVTGPAIDETQALLSESFGEAPELPPTAAPNFRVAHTIQEVLSAWRLVYNVYLHTGFINPNAHLIHTLPQALSGRAAVFQSTSSDAVESTLTAVVDGPAGLPLDKVYKKELDALRRRGRQMMESCLFAHTCQISWFERWTNTSWSIGDDTQHRLARMKSSIIHLMRLAFHYAIGRNSIDFVVGVHPKHARFYTRAFGFRQIGEEKSYATVNHRPVVLLHADLETSLQMSPLPYALDFCLNNPVPLGMYDSRFKFTRRDLATAPVRLDAYLREKHPRFRLVG